MAESRGSAFGRAPQGAKSPQAKTHWNQLAKHGAALRKIINSSRRIVPGRGKNDDEKPRGAAQ